MFFIFKAFAISLLNSSCKTSCISNLKREIMLFIPVNYGGSVHF
ncbi:hypothetical protein DCCM_3800 [Desulfocucumis palustris]|uniref:Uncharacterized protein n=1 Tax=Desulfocucumis palustris TaxID=1898651 RepID=A0A2L2XEU6_9FIRM|nr:hypothetical protein DCCM_3800 [Desulfocucumis palustris]